MGRIECGRVQGTTHTLLGLTGHDIPRVVAVDKVVVVERLAGWQVLAWSADGARRECHQRMGSMV
jgi:hypothetical protein